MGQQMFLEGRPSQSGLKGQKTTKHNEVGGKYGVLFSHGDKGDVFLRNVDSLSSHFRHIKIMYHGHCCQNSKPNTK
jgi:hypothetical protein